MLATNPDQQILQTLFDQLDVTEKTYDQAFLSISQLVALSGEANRAITALDDVNTEIALRWQPKFNKVVPLLFRANEPVSVVHSLFNQADLFSLEVCADTLHRRAPELTIPEENLTDVLTLLREAIDAITADASLPPEVRNYFTVRLSDIERAIRAYYITGYGGIQAAVEGLTGAIVLRADDVQNSPESVSWLRKIINALTLGASGAKAIESIAESSQAIIESMQ